MGSELIVSWPVWNGETVIGLAGEVVLGNRDDTHPLSQPGRQTDPRTEDAQDQWIARLHQLHLASNADSHRSESDRIFGMDLQLFNANDGRRDEFRESNSFHNATGRCPNNRSAQRTG